MNTTNRETVFREHMPHRVRDVVKHRDNDDWNRPSDKFLKLFLLKFFDIFHDENNREDNHNVVINQNWCVVKPVIENNTKH